jgi:hypothetical protein
VIVSTHNNRFALTFLLPVACALAGCAAGNGTFSSVGSGSPITVPATAITGQVYGGQQAISGANVTVWKVNTDGSAASSLLQTGVTVTTTSSGSFSLASTLLTADLTSGSCNLTSEVYIMATGGNPGLSSGTNGSIALMAALGPCNTALTTSTHITINEATTVAAVWALQQFMGVSEGTPYAEDIAVGPTTQSVTGMINAFSMAQNLVSTTTGLANASLGNATYEQSKLYTIANVLANCVNSNGSGDCPSLFSAVTPSGGITPGDTIQAALYMAANPSNNVSAIFGLQPTSPPFQPGYATAPFDWALAVTYTSDSLNLPNLLAADSSGNVWITDAASSNAENLVEITPSGTTASGSPFLTGIGLAPDQPQAVVLDTLGNIWISAHGGGSTTGNRLYSFNTTATKEYVLPSGCYPYAMAIDGQDDVFFACSGNGSSGTGTPDQLYELTNSTTGTPSSTNLPSYPCGTGSTSGSVTTYTCTPTAQGLLGSSTATTTSPESYGMAIDALGDVWVANTLTNTSAKTVTEYTPGSNNTYPLSYTFTPGSATTGIAVDHSNNAWTVAGSTLDELIYSSPSSYTTNSFTGGGLASGAYLAIDGAGNIWVANATPASVTVNSTITNYVTISEFNSNGTPVTNDVSTLQPGGLATPITITSPQPRGITIDPSGNVWIAGCGNSTSCSSGTTPFVMEYVGVASPPVKSLATAIANNQLGCCSFTPVAPNGTAPTSTAGVINFVIPSAVANASGYGFDQNNGTFSFEITRTGGFTGALTINYATSNGTATAGTDYTATSGTLTWANGDSSVRTITVPWLRTTGYTGNKTFNIALTCTSTTCPVSYSPSSSETVTVTDTYTPPSTSNNFPNFNGSTIAFYLGMPVDQYGGTGGTGGDQFAWQTVQPATLAAGFSDLYFYLNGSNQIVFTAPSNGATSSPGVGTNDTRSELREYYYGSNNIDSDDWDSSVGGTLTATVAVNATSADTFEATIGQIHGQNQPFALLEYEPTCHSLSSNPNGYTGCVFIAYVLTNTTNSASSTALLAYNVQLNYFFTYTLKLSGSTLSAAVSSPTSGTLYTGTSNGVSVSNGSASITVDSSWVGTGTADGMYFKIGAYSGAANTGNPAGDETQVTVSSFSITHP